MKLREGEEYMMKERKRSAQYRVPISAHKTPEQERIRKRNREYRYRISAFTVIDYVQGF